MALYKAIIYEVEGRFEETNNYLVEADSIHEAFEVAEHIGQDGNDKYEILSVGLLDYNFVWSLSDFEETGGQ